VTNKQELLTTERIKRKRSKKRQKEKEKTRKRKKERGARQYKRNAPVKKNKILRVK